METIGMLTNTNSNSPYINKKHHILIQDSIIEDIEKVMILPNEYKSKIKELCLSKDLLNISLATEILKTIDKSCNIVFQISFIYDFSPFIKDPSRNAILTLT